MSRQHSYDLHFRLGKVMPSRCVTQKYEEDLLVGIESALVLLETTAKQGDMQCAVLAVGAIEQLNALRDQLTNSNWTSRQSAKYLLSEVNKAQADLKTKVERLYFARLVLPVAFLSLLIWNTFEIVPLLFLAFYGPIVDGWLKGMLVEAKESKETIAFIARVAKFIEIAVAVNSI